MPNFNGSKPVSPLRQQVAKCFTARVALKMSSLGAYEFVGQGFGVSFW